MKFDELLEFIDKQGEKIEKHYEENADKEKKILRRAVKLNEEVGEFCSEILSSLNYQRKEKLQDYKTEKLNDEFADVLITTLLVAWSLDIDIEKALENKIEKILNRDL
jgi:NTP pyrophosphatase (non-canonical NTP hydrolase)